MDDGLFDISDRVALITGGAGGLGAVLAEAFARRGAAVTVADLDSDHADATIRQLPAGRRPHFALGLDVRRSASCEAAVAEVLSRFGRLDILINAAGLFRPAPALELDERTWSETLSTNLSGVFFMSRAAARAMAAQGRGRVITVTSVSSTVANPGYAAYAASKAGASHLCRVLALEWATQGITVNAIGPALTETPLTRDFLAVPQRRRAGLDRIPLGRFGLAQDLIGAAVFLASDAGAFVTGQTLYVDGGRTIS